jgi:hypothetical protein
VRRTNHCEGETLPIKFNDILLTSLLLFTIRALKDSWQSFEIHTFIRHLKVFGVDCSLVICQAHIRFDLFISNFLEIDDECYLKGYKSCI